jgi:hypothetical protein
MVRRNRSAAAQLLNKYANRVDSHDARQRMAERDERERADTRTPAQIWLNDPPPERSALAQSGNKNRI